MTLRAYFGIIIPKHREVVVSKMEKVAKITGIYAGVVLAALLSASALSGCRGTSCACPCTVSADDGGPNVSIFIHAVRRVAKNRGVTLAAAAAMFYEAGVRGVDINPDAPDLDEISKTKLKPINFFFFPRMFAADNGAADCRRCFDQAVRYGVPRVMIVPSGFTDGGDEAAEFAKIVSSMKMFVEEGRKRGITVTIEDYGGTSNPCSHAKYLKRLLDEVPGLCFALDSGNMYYAGRGESIVDMMNYAKSRVRHVHLKDMSREDNHKYVTLGLGAVPNEEVVKTVSASGYDGWYTLENLVGDDAVADAHRQIAVLKFWIGK